MDDVERFRERATKAMTQVGRDLRKRTTSAEELLWHTLRDRNFERIKFRRQHALAGTAYVADFYCYESRLAIELDGSVHDDAQQRSADLERQQAIEAFGHRVLRFRNEQVVSDIATVLTTILIAHTERVRQLESSDNDDRS